MEGIIGATDCWGRIAALKLPANVSQKLEPPGTPARTGQPLRRSWDAWRESLEPPTAGTVSAPSSPFSPGAHLHRIKSTITIYFKNSSLSAPLSPSYPGAQNCL